MADDAGLINEVLAETSFLYGGNAAFVEDLYAKWAANPESVEPSWRAFFASLLDKSDEVKRAAGKPAGPVRSPLIDLDQQEQTVLAGLVAKAAQWSK